MANQGKEFDAMSPIIVNDGLKLTLNDDGDIELFFDFSDDCIGIGFSWFNFATGEFP